MINAKKLMLVLFLVIITSLGVVAVDIAVDNHGQTLGDSAGVSAKYGFKFLVKDSNATLLNATMVSTGSCTTAYLLNGSKNQLASASFTGLNAVFNRNLTSGDSYYITCDAGGGAYSLKYKDPFDPAFPISNVFINWTGGINNGVDVTTQGNNFQSLTLQNNTPEILAPADTLTINFPSNNYVFTTPTQLFNFTPVFNQGTGVSARLLVNGTQNKINYTITNNSVNNFVINKSVGTYLGLISINNSIGNITNASVLFNVSDINNPVCSILAPQEYEFTTSINGTCTDDFGILNVSINRTDFSLKSGSSASNFVFNYTGSSSFINESILVTCTDINGRTGSRVINISVDSVIPSCSFPSEVDIVAGDTHNWNNTCSDDLNLYMVNVTCSNGFIFGKDNINSTSYQFVNSTQINSTTTCTWFTADAHTLMDVTEFLNPYTTDVELNKISTIEKEGLIELELSDSATLDYSSLDRVMFSVDSPDAKSTFVFKVNGDDKVDYVKNPLFKGWFVVDHTYWVDFENNYDAEVSVNRVNSTQYVVEVTTLYPVKSIDFNSFGILNTNSQTQTFNVVGGAELIAGSCPTTSVGFSMLWIIVSLGAVFLIAGIVLRLGVMAFFGSLMLMTASYFVIGCVTIIGLLLMLLGLFFAVWSFTALKPQ